MRQALQFLLYAVLLCALLTGTLWPENMDFLLPESFHYSHWPLWAKVAGWAVVILLILADFLLPLDASKKRD